MIDEPASGSMETSGPPGIIKPFRLENIWIEIMRMKTNLTTWFLGFNLSEVVGLIYGPVDNYWNNLNTSSFQPFHIAADDNDLNERNACYDNDNNNDIDDDYDPDDGDNIEKLDDTKPCDNPTWVIFYPGQCGEHGGGEVLQEKSTLFTTFSKYQIAWNCKCELVVLQDPH